MAGIPNWTRFDEVADSYDEHFLTTREPARQLVDFMQISRGAELLELGCGTGFATFLAANAVGRNGTILATDIAEKMVEVARTRALEEGISNVEFRCIDGADLAFTDGSFDYVFANAVLMGIPDVAGAVTEWARVVRPGGTVAFSSFSRDYTLPLASSPDALDVFRRYVGEPPRLKLPPNDVDTIEKCEKLLTGVGLIGIEVREIDLGYHYSDFEVFWNEWWSSLFRLSLQALEATQVELMRTELKTAMSDAFSGEGLYRPNITILAKARKST